MNESLIPGRWYRLELPLEKIFYAEYIVEKNNPQVSWFRFLDGSRKATGDVLPYVTSIIEIEAPEKSRNYDIRDYTDVEE
ncbi:MAG: hypothetical protein U5P10_15490 [Spirochaetia bacterium]|nr:hypothetical protein [Spirochaetia bacterium]